MFRVYCQKILPSKSNMEAFCLIGKEKTDNIGSKKVAKKTTNKVIIGKSICADCWSSKSKIFKEKSERKN